MAEEDSKMNPTLHKPVPMYSRVKIPKRYHGLDEDVIGTIVGVSSVHVIFTYIVYLDNELKSSFGSVRGIVVPGPELEGLDGTNWRLQ